MAVYQENYLVLKRQYPKVSVRGPGRLSVAPPQTAEEREYRDLLSEANTNFFHREYAVALQNYLALRQKILVQSDPKMPASPGPWVFEIAPSKIDSQRIFEMSRRQLVNIEPGARVTLSLENKALVENGDLPGDPAFRKYSNVGLDPRITAREDVQAQRKSARRWVLEGELERAEKMYTGLRKEALGSQNAGLAAEIAGELGAMLATYAAGDDRKRSLERALSQFNEAEKMFALAGDVDSQRTMRENAEKVRKEISGTPGTGPKPVPAPRGRRGEGARAAAAAVERAIPPQTANLYQVVEAEKTRPALALVAAGNAVKPTDRQVGLLVDGDVKVVSLAPGTWQMDLGALMYNPRVAATTLESLRFWEEIQSNFVAYIPHLFYFVLPIAIGDTYVALGNYQRGIQEFQEVLPYPFLNLGIEAPYVWLRMARARLRAGDDLFRRERPAEAKAQYEQILKTDLTLPLTSSLYASAAMTPMRNVVLEVVKQIQDQPSAAVNPKVSQVVMQAHVQLQKIANSLNFLGLGADDYPIFRFKYLQGVANYLADHAVQAERTFINFRATAENQKLDRIQLENAVEVNQAAVAVEQKRLDDAALEVQAATQSRQLTELRRDNANAALADWNTLGRELASVNAALSWASNAANDQDITYTGVRYDGETHNFDTDVEEFYDVVGEWRENLNFEIQQNRLERQAAEIAAEVPLAMTRQQQAQVRYQVQQLSIQVARKRLEGAQEMLDYATDRLFDEDLWFQLAGELQDLSRDYLDMAIYAAFLMERAYELEFDRKLNRIRLDYGIGGVENLLGGDYLKRDIASFSIDYLQYAQKKNPVRYAISLRDEFPAAYDTFLTQGLLPFRTDLEIFDRRYPGTFRRKLKKIEVFVEGLVPLEGAVGYLHNQGVSSEWAPSGNAWIKKPRIMPAERLALSSYQFRRDLTVFQPSEEMLDLFENLGPQCNWLLELPLSNNNLDYQAISDVKFVVYFDADFDPSLRDFQKTFYSSEGGRTLILSSRFHFPDEYFRLDQDRETTFELHAARFAYNHTALRLNGFGVRVIARTGATAAGLPLTVTRESDDSKVDVTTDANGAVLGAAGTMAPFGAWKDASPVDSFTVALGDGVDSAEVADVQLSLDYKFDYRADGTLPV